jgi:hypothetical protein
MDKKSGFTLLEALVALTITALVLGGVALSVGAWSRANDRAREHMELYQGLERVMNRMQRDISSIYVSPYTTSPVYVGFETFDLETVNAPYDAFTFSSLAHRVHRIDAHESELIEMTYFTVEDEKGLSPEGTRILRHREGGMIDDQFEVEGGTVYDMASGVTRFIIDYLSPDGDLKHEWRLSDHAGTCSVIPIYLTNNSPCRYEHDTLDKVCEE